MKGLVISSDTSNHFILDYPLGSLQFELITDTNSIVHYICVFNINGGQGLTSCPRSSKLARQEFKGELLQTK